MRSLYFNNVCQASLARKTLYIQIRREKIVSLKRKFWFPATWLPLVSGDKYGLISTFSSMAGGRRPSASWTVRVLPCMLRAEALAHIIYQIKTADDSYLAARNTESHVNLWPRGSIALTLQSRGFRDILGAPAGGQVTNPAAVLLTTQNLY